MSKFLFPNLTTYSIQLKYIIIRTLSKFKYKFISIYCYSWILVVLWIHPLGHGENLIIIFKLSMISDFQDSEMQSSTYFYLSYFQTFLSYHSYLCYVSPILVYVSCMSIYLFRDHLLHYVLPSIHAGFCAVLKFRQFGSFEFRNGPSDLHRPMRCQSEHDMVSQNTDTCKFQ